MANLLINRTLKSIGNSKLIGALSSRARPPPPPPSSPHPTVHLRSSPSPPTEKKTRATQDDSIYVKSPSSSSSKR
ncbi:hypothetical protein FF1_023319 [Malus domestica]